MKTSSCVPTLVVGTLVVSVLCTLMISGGWMIWVPIVPALLIVSRLSAAIFRK